MSIPDYIPPGMRWNGLSLEPIQADNLDNAQKLIQQKNAQIEALEVVVKEWEAKFKEYWDRGLPPVLKEKYAAIEAENKALKDQLAKTQPQEEPKARKAKAEKQESPKAEV
jgi:hypothetical protein